jgi:hypothetical protein
MIDYLVLVRPDFIVRTFVRVHTATTKKLKAAPFRHTRIDAAQFSPDGKLLAISDRNELVLWRWEENTHERIDLGRCIGSLTFTPDGKSAPCQRGRFQRERDAPCTDQKTSRRCPQHLQVMTSP